MRDLNFKRAERKWQLSRMARPEDACFNLALREALLEINAPIRGSAIHTN
jgi:hypothetical protein